MKNRIWMLGCLLVFSGYGFAQGLVKGKVLTDSVRAPGVTVLMRGQNSNYNETSVTDQNGTFRFADVPAGTYNLTFTFVGMETHVEPDVTVNDGQTVDLNITMSKPLNVMESLTVASASRTPERIVEAPAAISVISGRELEAKAAHGQLPRVLENTPGVQLGQAGVYDFNINSRGFNSSLNRRILVLIDGRDPATGLLGNQEWASLTAGLDEFESMEFVRGPGSALYGANAFNGVLNIRSKRPIDTQGGRVNVSGGELDTRRADVRYAGEFGFGWSYRVNAGTFASETWSRSRTRADLNPNGEFEYPGLGAPENEPLDEDDVKGNFFSFRIDKETLRGDVWTFEYGFSNSENILAVTGIGRVQIDESERPWFRLNYNSRHWNAMFWQTERKTPIGQTSLSSGNTLWEDSVDRHIEVQGNYDLANERVSLVFGAAYHEEEVDSRNPDGFNTILDNTFDEDQSAVFGQVKFKAHEKIDLFFAARWDDSSLHDSEVSPKGAIVYKINPNHSVRFTYNEAFQAPNYSEFFLKAVSATTIPFGAIQDGVSAAIGINLRTPDGQPVQPGQLNWQNLPVVARGNNQLSPESIESFEVGYKGIISGNLFLTVDVYQSTLNNFVTDLLPGVNRSIPGYQFAEQIPVPIQQALIGAMQRALGPAFFGLTNLSDNVRPFTIDALTGQPVLVVSYANAGKVDTEGADIALNYYINDRWSIDANLSIFDFDVIDQQVGDALVPNSSETVYNLGVSYDGEYFNGSLSYHHVDDFPWNAGSFAGDIPSYDTVNMTARYKFHPKWNVSLNGTNIFDDEHVEIFGGSINGRRILAALQFNF